MRKNLRDSTEFQHVYNNGRRFEGALITVFVIGNDVSQHRLGVTASRRALGNAVHRNRAKRLMREAFWNNRPALEELQRSYDWVLNAKTRIVSEKVSGPAEELRNVIAKVRKIEISSPPREPV